MGNDMVHIQWTGSNTHNNGNPAGDGQAGDAGEGTGGTDRNNFVALHSTGANYPSPWKSSDATKAAEFDRKNLLKHVDCWAPAKTTLTGANGATQSYGGGANTDKMDLTDNSFVSIPSDACALRLASSNYYKTTGDLTAADTKMNVLLNNASPSLVKGVIMMGKTKGTYDFMCTRNNNFSNRSEKGAITIE